MSDQIERAVACLRDGGVVAVPTDTQYALAVDALNETAVGRVFHIKGRPQGMALPILISCAEALNDVADEVPEVASRLARRYWPGALTLVVRRSASVPSAVAAGLDTVAVRVPDHPIPRSISSRLGCPITGTSANATGSPPLNSAADLRREFGDSLDYVVEGTAPGGRPSTILDVTGDAPVIIREGAITADELADYIGEAVQSLVRASGPLAANEQ